MKKPQGGTHRITTGMWTACCDVLHGPQNERPVVMCCMGHKTKCMIVVVDYSEQ
jgi:hypothetical protein